MASEALLKARQMRPRPARLWPLLALASEQHYIDAAGNPKQLLLYDTGHELNDPQVLRDRYEWLAKQIGLRSNLQV